jgi:hypothetical protein
VVCVHATRSTGLPLLASWGIPYRSLADDKSKEIKPKSVLLDVVKHPAICIFLLKLESHTEPRPIGPARFLRRRKAELLMSQGGCQTRFQTQPHPSSTIHHPDVSARGPEIGRRHGAELSRYYREFSSVHRGPGLNLL